MSQTIQIRSFRPEDAQGLAELFFASVRELGPRHYSPEQVAAWAPAIPDPGDYRSRASDGRVFLIAVDGENQPAAYGDLEMNGHIDHFFCRPDAAGTGITSILYDHLERFARGRTIVRLYVEASEAARGFFLRKGFAELERREFLLRGILVHNYAMEKLLNPSHA
jgi:putative acetyltransferase